MAQRAAVAFVVLLWLLMPFPPLAVEADSEEEDSAAGAGIALTTIFLRRQQVPVIRNGTIIANKSAQVGRIFVGEPRQAFTVVFDTGSGHLVLPSTGCSSEACSGKRLFNRTASRSATNIDSSGALSGSGERRRQVAITFGAGRVEGDLLHETVCLGLTPERPQDGCAGLNLVAATSMSEEPFQAFGFDGVLGLGLGSLSLTPDFSFLGAYARQREGMRPQFSVFLSADDEEPSEISFGGHSEARLASPLQWAPVVDAQQGYWQVQLRGVRIGGEPLELCALGGCRAILDSGTSMLGVPRSQLRVAHRALARVLPEEHGPADCRDEPGPPIVFELDGFDIDLSTRDYSREEPASMLVAGGSPGYRRDFCRASLLPVDSQEPLGPSVFVFGEPVLRRFYTVYDWGRQRIGFGLARHAEGRSQRESPQKVSLQV
mmetsp:Transcript_40180/g.85733  ORF Transcript_40180/g.85733 Transcript_40180/m.85733 type:complete len:432 (+) Transcript_40180:209-1504(+)